MEKHVNKGILKNPELQQAIKKSEWNLGWTEVELQENLKDLEEFVRDLEIDQDYLRATEEENKWIEANKEEAQKIGLTGTKKEDIEKMREDIESTKTIVKQINDELERLASRRTSLQAEIERFRDLEKRFKAILLKIKPEQLQ